MTKLSNKGICFPEPEKKKEKKSLKQISLRKNIYEVSISTSDILKKFLYLAGQGILKGKKKII